MDHPENLVKVKDEILNVEVRNSADESLGEISEIMLDKLSGNVAYIVLESGSMLGIGGKLFALPWHAVHFDPEKNCFILNTDKEKIQNSPGFDKNNWPATADNKWGEPVSQTDKTTSLLNE